MKIAIIGVFGTGADFTTGQAVKCMEISRWLTEHYGAENVILVNTYQWKKHPDKLLRAVIGAFRQCDRILMLPAQHGLKVFAPMTYYLGRLFHKQLHYIVIGGWLPKLLSENARMKKFVSSYQGVYVETKSMEQRMRECGVERCWYMPNCRFLPDVLPARREWQDETRSVCTYSRVTKTKGIEDAVEIVRRANALLGAPVFRLDVYGKVAQEYLAELEQTMAANQDIAVYAGVKGPDEGIETLSQYFALLFPTYYEGEGFAGTVLDAFAAQTPVIANDWKYNAEVISSGVDGFIYPFRDVECAAKQLVQLYQEDTLYRSIQHGCMESARRYSTQSVMSAFLEKLEG